MFLDQLTDVALQILANYERVFDPVEVGQFTNTNKSTNWSPLTMLISGMTSTLS